MNLDKYTDKEREKLIIVINAMCEILEIDPWELDCFSKHECE